MSSKDYNEVKVTSSRTALFVPGDRPERFDKAYNSGADLVIIDLEDSVNFEHKDVALVNAIEALSPNNGENAFEAIVRINKDRMSIELPRLIELSQVPGNRILGVMFPKVESPSDIPHDLGDLSVIALIESAQGIENVSSIARAEGVSRLAFGAVDFEAELETNHPSVLNYARSRVIISSRSAGLPQPLDSPSLVVADMETLAREARESALLGFGGKLCIHPSQISPTLQSFVPSAKDVEWAQLVLYHAEGATQVEGKMVDRPVYEKAEKILRKAKLRD
jgi:citrate lyase beta subunit